MSPGRTATTPERGGGTETLTPTPNEDKMIQCFQKDQLHRKSLDNEELAEENISSLQGVQHGACLRRTGIIPFGHTSNLI